MKESTLRLMKDEDNFERDRAPKKERYVAAKFGTIIQEMACQRPGNWCHVRSIGGRTFRLLNCKVGAFPLSPHAALLLRRPSYLGIRAVEDVSGVIVQIIRQAHMSRNDTQFYPARSRARQLTNDKRLGNICEMFPLMRAHQRSQGQSFISPSRT